MGLIKINNIVYGTNSASDIIYKGITVEEKLDAIPVFDPSDNANIEANYDFLTYGHIIDNLNSTESNKILSAKQGKTLDNKINNVLDKTNINASNILDNTNTINLLSESLENLVVTVTEEEWNNMSDIEKNQGIYIISDSNDERFTAKNILYNDENNNLGSTVDNAITTLNEKHNWKLVGEVTAGNSLALPNEWNELAIVCTDIEYNTTIINYCPHELVKHFSLNTVLGGGYGASNSYGLYYSTITDTTFALNAAYWNGQVRLSYITSAIYYR